MTSQEFYEDDGIVSDGEAEQTWDSYDEGDDGVVFTDLSFEQAQLEDSLGRPLNGTETMALQNALDQGVEGTLGEIYNIYREIRGTPEGREALMKARYNELRDGNG